MTDRVRVGSLDIAMAARSSPRGFVEPIPDPAIVDRPFRAALVAYARSNRKHRLPLTVEFTLSSERASDDVEAVAS
jgi:hypothetical protein